MKSIVSIQDQHGRHVLTGQVVGKDGVSATILTTAHDMPTVPIIRYHDGQRAYALIVGTSQQYDVGLLKARAGDNVSKIPIAGDVADANTDLAYVTRRGIQRGKFMAYTAISHDGLDRPKYLASVKTSKLRYQTDVTQLLLAGNIRDGDSGGAVLNRRGSIVAINWGDSNPRSQHVYGTYNKVLIDLLNRAKRKAGLKYDLAANRIAQGDRGPF